MKTQSFMCAIAILMWLVIPSACSKKNDADLQSGTGAGSATLKVTKNGQVITQFSSVKAVCVGGGGYTVTFASDDTKHSLVLSVAGESTGTYPFINNTNHESLTTGKANFLYQSYDLPPTYPGTDGVLIPSGGNVVVKTAAKNRCSGSFAGSGINDKDGKTYVLEGNFDTPVL